VALSSINEIPERPLEYEAFLPMSEGEESVLAGPASPFFEVRLVSGHGLSTGRLMTGVIPRVGVVQSLVAHDEDADYDLTLTSPGIDETVFRVSSDVTNYISENDVILQPVTLGEASRVRLRKVKVQFVPDPTIDPWHFPVFLPLARIHRPSIRGCVTTYSVATTKVQTYEADFSFGGSGLGASVEFRSTLKRTYSASASCKEVRVPAQAAIVYGTTLMNGEPVSDGTRVHIFGVEDRTIYADLKPELDQCGWDVSRIPQQTVTDDDLSSATGERDDSMTDERTITRKGSGKIALGVDLGKVPFKVSASYSRSCEHEVIVTTTYMPGWRYVGYLPQLINQDEKCFTVVC
jgi:hypothetical protein